MGIWISPCSWIPDFSPQPNTEWKRTWRRGFTGSFRPEGCLFPPLEILTVNNAPNHFLVKMLKGPYLILKGEEGEITDFIEAVGAKSMANFHFRMESLKEVAEG
jgi:hypothetical protein